MLVAACYAFTAGALVRTVATAFGAPYPPVDAFARGSVAFQVVDNLLFAPVLESLILIGTIELLRWLRFPVSLQVACSATVAASLHAFVSIPLAFIVAPAWFIMSIAYLVWRRTSWKTGFVVVASIHALLNLIPAISTSPQSAQKQTDSWEAVRSAIDQIDYDKASAIAERILKRYPNDYYGYAYLGNIALATDRIEDAERSFARAYDLLPSEENEKMLRAVRKRIESEKPIVTQ